jgi:DNA invertase Pin-like site-specific DNA recombinase
LFRFYELKREDAMLEPSFLVALYVRTSAAKPSQDVNAQLEPLRNMCVLRGWKIEKEYRDEGYSGVAKKRPGFDELMRDAERGYHHFNAILVWKYDRFSRSTRQLLASLDLFTELGISFLSLTEPIDPGTPYGKLVFTCRAAVAEVERAMTAERIKNGMKKAGAKRPGPRISENGPSRSTLWRRAQRTA